LKRAILDKKIKVKFYNPRDFADNRHDRIDRKPFGGGPGMVIQALPVIKAVEKSIKSVKSIKSKIKIVWLAPNGKQFTNGYAKATARKNTDIIIICGRYEGIDARVKKVLNTTPIHESKRMTRMRVEEISVGPFISTGGELPAMMMIDVISRQIEGVLGDFNSLEESRIASPDVYTRPEIFEYKKKKYRVPKILLSGNHAKIEEWKKNSQKSIKSIRSIK